MRDVRPTARLREAAAIDDDVRAWLDVMPEAVAHYLDAWALDAGHAYEPGGNTAWVAPVRTRDGEERVLKVGMRHPEAEHEAEALRLWEGAGAVRLQTRRPPAPGNLPAAWQAEPAAGSRPAFA